MCACAPYVVCTYVCMSRLQWQWRGAFSQRTTSGCRVSLCPWGNNAASIPTMAGIQGGIQERRPTLSTSLLLKHRHVTSRQVTGICMFVHTCTLHINRNFVSVVCGLCYSTLWWKQFAFNTRRDYVFDDTKFSKFSARVLLLLLSLTVFVSFCALVLFCFCRTDCFVTFLYLCDSLPYRQ